MVNINLSGLWRNKFSDGVPKRLILGVMLFFACFMSYMVRVNLSINVIAMVKQTPGPNETYEEVNPNLGPRYDWSKPDQSLLLGAFFWGYCTTSLFGGPLAEKFGGSKIVGYSLIVTAIFNSLMPLSAQLSLWITFTNRLITGALAGVLFPACHNLISKWSPPDEKGKFIAALMGGTFGTVLTWMISGAIIEALGWIWAFYVVGVITFCFAILWLILVADSPSKHPKISKSELEYIENSLGSAVSKENVSLPYLRIILSIPFWALLILHFGNLWGLYFLITAAPKFMSEVLKFKLSAAGFLSALPYLARFIFAFIFGTIGDIIRKRNIMSVTLVRKTFCVTSHIIPGVFLIILAYFIESPIAAVSVIVLSLGFNGSATITNLQNSQDLAPNFAGTLYGIINFVGNFTGFITPLIVGYFTQEHSTFAEWRYIFLIGAAAYIIPAIVFIVFGSGKVQSWNDKKKNDDVVA